MAAARASASPEISTPALDPGMTFQRAMGFHRVALRLSTQGTVTAFEQLYHIPLGGHPAQIGMCHAFFDAAVPAPVNPEPPRDRLFNSIAG